MQFLLLSLQTKLRCRSLCVHFFIIWEFAEFWSNCLSLSLVLIEAPALLSSRTITHTRILHTQLSSSYSTYCLFWEISRRHNNIVTCEKWCQFLFGWSSRKIVDTFLLFQDKLRVFISFVDRWTFTAFFCGVGCCCGDWAPRLHSRRYMFTRQRSDRVCSCSNRTWGWSQLYCHVPNF